MTSEALKQLPGERAGVKRRPLRFWDSRFSGVALVAALAAWWEISARFGFVQSLNWPPLDAVLVALVKNLLNGELAEVIGATLWVMARGFVTGSALGMAVGFAVALWRPVQMTVEPTLEILRTIPVAAVIPPLIFIFGLGDPLKIFIISFATVFPVALNTISGIEAIDPTHLQVARTFGIPRARLWWQVVLPAATPFIMAGLRTSLALALIVAVVSEMLAGSGGVGYYLLQTQFALRMADMYAAIIFLAAVAYLINRAFLWWESRVIHWARTRETTGSDE